MDKFDALIKRIERLEKAVFEGKSEFSNPPPKTQSHTHGLSFNLNERAFMKRYAASKAGPAKFTLALAYLSRGEIEKSIELAVIERCWNRMSAIIGKFNRFYSNQAKTNGWVDSKSKGVYELTGEWQECTMDAKDLKKHKTR